jgi:hypothetical protein
MQQIADWLKKLGMSEYAERFAENRIDLSVLPDLTDQHLEKLGVALRDRLKILRAIPTIWRCMLSDPSFDDYLRAGGWRGYAQKAAKSAFVTDNEARSWPEPLQQMLDARRGTVAGARKYDGR